MNKHQWAEQHLGIKHWRWSALRRIERQLQLWGEDECNGLIQWDDETESYWRYSVNGFGEPAKRFKRLPDRPAIWLTEADRLASAVGLKVYHQSDPRGCQLWLYREEDLAKCSRGADPAYGIGAYYNTIGTAVC